MPKSFFERSKIMTRFFATFVLGASVMLGFSGGNSNASVTIYDDFPGASLNNSLWIPSGNVSVGGGILTLGNPTGGWVSTYSTQTYGDATALQGYVFKVASDTTNNGIYNYMGVRDKVNGDYAVITTQGGSYYQIDVNGTLEGSHFSINSGDMVELRRTTSNWEVYINGGVSPVASSVDAGTLSSGDNARLFMAVDPDHSYSYDWVGVNAIPEPAGLTLLGLTLVPMIRRRRC